MSELALNITVVTTADDATRAAAAEELCADLAAQLATANAERDRAITWGMAALTALQSLLEDADEVAARDRRDAFETSLDRGRSSVARRQLASLVGGFGQRNARRIPMGADR